MDETNLTMQKSCQDMILSEDYIDLILNIERQSNRELLERETSGCMETINNRLAIFH